MIGVIALAAAATAALHFPPPPPVPKIMGTGTYVADSLFLGGAVEQARERKARQQRVVYEAEVRAFMAAHSPDELNALEADPAEESVVAAAVAYFTATAYLAVSAPKSDTRSRPPNYNVGAASILPTPSDGTRVYSPSECIGPIVNGECHGAIQPNSAYHPTCHGQMLNGACTGPMF